MVTRAARQVAPLRWYTAGLIAAFNLLLLAWLVLKPGSHAMFVAVDNVAQFVGPLLVVPLCFLGGWRGDRPRVCTAQQWAPCLLGLGALTYAGGRIICTIYQQVLQYPSTSFPSWAHAVYLCTYPVLLLGILLLPGRRLPVASRVRVLLDGLTIMTAVLTFSWYFILGPTIAQGGQTPLAVDVGLAYPLGDLVLITCLLVLWSRLEEPDLRRVMALLSCALGIIVLTDTVYDYQNLHGGYSTGGLLDVGWPLGYMLVALGGYALRRVLAARALPAPADLQPASAAAGHPTGPLGLWSSLLPSALVPAVGALLLYTRFVGKAGQYDTGVAAGGLPPIAIIVLRQVFTILENRRLYARLDAAYTVQ